MTHQKDEQVSWGTSKPHEWWCWHLWFPVPRPIYPTFHISTRVTAGLIINTETQKIALEPTYHDQGGLGFLYDQSDELRRTKISRINTRMEENFNQVSNVSNECELTCQASSSPFPYSKISTTSDKGAVRRLSLGYWETGCDEGNIPEPEFSGPSLFPWVHRDIMPPTV